MRTAETSLSPAEGAFAARVLALQPGRVVAAEQLIDEVAGRQIRPRRCATGFRGSRRSLRRSLRSADLVAIRGAGYSLELPAEAIDVHRYEELVATARDAAAGGDLNCAAAGC